MSTNLDVAETLRELNQLPSWLIITLVLIGCAVLAVIAIIALSKNEYTRMIFTNRANYNLDMIIREELHVKIRQLDLDCEWELKQFVSEDLLHHDFGLGNYCILPRELLLWRIEKHAEDWIEQNHLLQKVLSDNIEHSRRECLQIITKLIHSYKFIMDGIEECDRVDPDFRKDFETKDSLKDEVTGLVDEFINHVRKSIINRTNKKIKLYNEYKDSFKTRVVRRIAVLDPLQKNNKYLEKLL